MKSYAVTMCGDCRRGVDFASISDDVILPRWRIFSMMMAGIAWYERVVYKRKFHDVRG